MRRCRTRRRWTRRPVSAVSKLATGLGGAVVSLRDVAAIGRLGDWRSATAAGRRRPGGRAAAASRRGVAGAPRRAAICARAAAPSHFGIDRRRSRPALRSRTCRQLAARAGGSGTVVDASAALDAAFGSASSWSRASRKRRRPATLRRRPRGRRRRAYRRSRAGAGFVAEPRQPVHGRRPLRPRSFSASPRSRPRPSAQGRCG